MIGISISPNETIVLTETAEGKVHLEWETAKHTHTASFKSTWETTKPQKQTATKRISLTCHSFLPLAFHLTHTLTDCRNIENFSDSVFSPANAKIVSRELSHIFSV